ncbi:MAG TPA: nitroreductase family protein, partial [Candidatus Melainabacteria bacterium]|nr:nitroreductase family protein [Candidatus Melainabacteria bacterium]
LQAELSEASALIFLASNQGRLRSKYGPRAYRLGLLDAGHVSENIYLVSAALDLAVTATGGFIDDELNNALGLDGIDDCVVLVLAVGKPV